MGSGSTNMGSGSGSTGSGSGNTVTVPVYMEWSIVNPSGGRKATAAEVNVFKAQADKWISDHIKGFYSGGSKPTFTGMTSTVRSNEYYASPVANNAAGTPLFNHILLIESDLKFTKSSSSQATPPMFEWVGILRNAGVGAVTEFRDQYLRPASGSGIFREGVGSIQWRALNMPSELGPPSAAGSDREDGAPAPAPTMRMPVAAPVMPPPTLSNADLAAAGAPYFTNPAPSPPTAPVTTMEAKLEWSIEAGSEAGKKRPSQAEYATFLDITKSFIEDEFDAAYSNFNYISGAKLEDSQFSASGISNNAGASFNHVITATYKLEFADTSLPSMVDYMRVLQNAGLSVVRTDYFGKASQGIWNPVGSLQVCHVDRVYILLAVFVFYICIDD